MTWNVDGAEALPLSFGCVVPLRDGGAALLKLGCVNSIGAPTGRRVDTTGGDGDGNGTASILASGRGFGSGSGLGGTAAVRSTGLGGTVGVARRGKRSGGGNTPSRLGSSVLAFGLGSAEASPSLSGGIGPPRGCGRVALLERGGGRGTAPGESDR